MTSTKAHWRVLAIALLAVGALRPAARANDVPRIYSPLDLRTAAKSIVVARVSGGADLPMANADCDGPNTWCVYFPFWYHADIRETLQGAPLAADTNVTTMSHYGHGAFMSGSTWRLLMLQSAGSRVEMPNFAWRPLETRSDGELFMIDGGWTWPSWLPCGAKDLLEPLGDATFTPDLAVARDDETGEFPPHVTGHPETWRIDGDRALPRAGVRVTRLRTLLRELADHPAPTDCRDKH